MGGKHHILCLDDALYQFDADDAREINGIRGLSGDKMIFSDFEGAVPRVATVEAGIKYAHAVLEKQLRESGEIESGGRMIVLLRRRRGQRTTELLYITAPPAVGMEGELERDHGGDEYLLFAVQYLFAQALAALKPRRPLAVMLIGERHIDVVVADRRVLYGAFRVSALKTGSNRDVLEKNFNNALQAVEREFNIDIDSIHCLHLFSRAESDYGWLEVAAGTRGIECSIPPASEIRIDGVDYRCSVLGLLHRMRAGDSCSPSSVINDYRANEALPWVAAAMVAGCAVALFFLVERHYQAGQVAERVAVLSSTLSARLDGTPMQMPAYQAYLDTAERLVHARSIPTLGQVLGHVSRATRNKATAVDEVEVEYAADRIVLILTGRTDKGPDSANRLVFYNRLIADLQDTGYILAQSELNTDTRLIDFTLRLERLIDKEPV